MSCLRLCELNSPTATSLVFLQTTFRMFFAFPACSREAPGLVVFPVAIIVLRFFARGCRVLLTCLQTSPSPGVGIPYSFSFSLFCLPCLFSCFSYFSSVYSRVTVTFVSVSYNTTCLCFLCAFLSSLPSDLFPAGSYRQPTRSGQTSVLIFFSRVIPHNTGLFCFPDFLIFLKLWVSSDSRRGS